MIRDALEEHCTKIILCCGYSGTTDAGSGMLEALGYRLLDARKQPLRIWYQNQLERQIRAAALVRLAEFVPDERNIGLDMMFRPKFEIVCQSEYFVGLKSDGKGKVTTGYAIQHGFQPNSMEAEVVVSAMQNYADLIKESTGIEVGLTGSCVHVGDLGPALSLIALDVEVISPAEALQRYCGLDHVLKQSWDFVVTADGNLHDRSLQKPGEATEKFWKMVKKSGNRVVCLAGAMNEEGPTSIAHCDAWECVVDRPESIMALNGRAKSTCEQRIRAATNRAVRLIQMGFDVAKDHHAVATALESLQDVIDVQPSLVNMGQT
ncbi:hypothetical protein VTK26DRAFT_7945 [Humicola hyalothermophila]